MVCPLLSKNFSIERLDEKFIIPMKNSIVYIFHKDSSLNVMMINDDGFESLIEKILIEYFTLQMSTLKITNRVFLTNHMEFDEEFLTFKVSETTQQKSVFHWFITEYLEHWYERIINIVINETNNFIDKITKLPLNVIEKKQDDMIVDIGITMGRCVNERKIRKFYRFNEHVITNELSMFSVDSAICRVLVKENSIEISPCDRFGIERITVDDATFDEKFSSDLIMKVLVGMIIQNIENQLEIFPEIVDGTFIFNEVNEEQKKKIHTILTRSFMTEGFASNRCVVRGLKTYGRFLRI